MKFLPQLLFSALCAQGVLAAQVSYNGTKPAVIIDVRTPEEFSAGHIDGALNIPFEQIGQGILGVKGLRKESPILLYCRTGRRSAIARETLERQGYKQILDGGGIETLSQSLKACTAKTC